MVERSYNGYPAIRESSGCRKWILPVGLPKREPRHVFLASGAPGFLLVHLASWFDMEIEDLNDPQEQWDDWGWAYRPVRGRNDVLSNHASGTAVDFNATKHPLAAKGTFRKWQYYKIRMKLRTTYKGCIRWGGDYSSRKDEMHFEINRDRAACIKVAKRLHKTKHGRRVRRLNPVRSR